MRSFFEGEIIDFKIHSLETENFSTDDHNTRRGEGGRGGRGGRSEGLAVDARYWRGVGPFRELLEQERAKRKDRIGAKGISSSHTSTRTRRQRHWEIGPEDRLVDDSDDNDHPRDDDEDSTNDDDYYDDDAAVEDSLGGEDILASHLRSRDWIENVLLRDWILMRWKERCFIRPIQSTSIGQDGAPAVVEAAAPTATIHRTEAGATTNGTSTSSDPSSLGLTISGFYYVALRRQTGEIDGLYFDPGSAPFQVLALRPVAINVRKGNGGGGGGGNQKGGGRISSPGTMAIKARWPAMQFR